MTNLCPCCCCLSVIGLRTSQHLKFEMVKVFAWLQHWHNNPATVAVDALQQQATSSQAVTSPLDTHISYVTNMTFDAAVCS